MWRAGVSVLEGLRNAVSGGARTGLLVVLGLAVLSAAGLFEAFTIDELQELDQELIAAGRDVVVIERGGNSPKGVQIDPTACESLNGYEGVIAAGIVQIDGRVTQPSGLGAQRVLVSPGGLAVLDGPGLAGRGLVGPSLVVLPETMQRFDARDGAEASMADQNGRSAHAVLRATDRTDARVEELSTSVLDVGWGFGSNAGCWIEVAAGGAKDPSAFVAALPHERDTLIGRSLLPEGRFQRDPAGSYYERPSRHGWWIGAAVLSGILALQIRYRRPEWALYASLRARRSTVTLIIAAETMVVMACSALAALTVLVGVAEITDLSIEPLLNGARQVGLGGLAALLITTLIAMAQPRRGLMTQLKER